MNREEKENARHRMLDALKRAGIILTEHEKAAMEITDLGLSRFAEIGLGIVVYVNTERVCAKELVLLPRQICPEHRHPPLFDDPGKEETFRCRSGVVYLYVPGEPTPNPQARLPQDKAHCFTVRHEIILRPGEQYTLAPNTLHWFQAGDEGAVVSEFSTTSRDEYDLFTDPEIRRVETPEAGS